MSYDNGNRVGVPLGSVTTTATVTKAIPFPPGKRGRLVNMLAGVTTTVVGPLVMQVGVAGNLAKFGTLTIGALVAPAQADSEVNTRGANGLITIIDPITAGDVPIVTFSGGTAGVVEAGLEIVWF